MKSVSLCNDRLDGSLREYSEYVNDRMYEVCHALLLAMHRPWDASGERALKEISEMYQGGHESTPTILVETGALHAIEELIFARETVAAAAHALECVYSNCPGLTEDIDIGPFVQRLAMNIRSEASDAVIVGSIMRLVTTIIDACCLDTRHSIVSLFVLGDVVQLHSMLVQASNEEIKMKAIGACLALIVRLCRDGAGLVGITSSILDVCGYVMDYVPHSFCRGHIQPHELCFTDVVDTLEVLMDRDALHENDLDRASNFITMHIVPRNDQVTQLTCCKFLANAVARGYNMDFGILADLVTQFSGCVRHAAYSVVLACLNMHPDRDMSAARFIATPECAAFVHYRMEDFESLRSCACCLSSVFETAQSFGCLDPCHVLCASLDMLRLDEEPLILAGLAIIHYLLDMTSCVESDTFMTLISRSAIDSLLADLLENKSPDVASHAEIIQSRLSDML